MSILSNRLLSFWFKLFGAVLGATSILKLLSLVQDERVLSVIDPVIGLQYRIVMIIAGTIEMAVCVFLWQDIAIYKKAVVVFSLTSIFATYRLLASQFDDVFRCPCLGNAAGWIGLHPNVVEIALWGVLTLGALPSLIAIGTELVNAKGRPHLVWGRR